MAKKSAQPALYELIKARGREATPDDAAPTSAARSYRDEPSDDFEPASRADSSLTNAAASARSIRIPMGWVYLSAAAILVLTLLAYMAGHLRGEADATDTFNDEVRSKFETSDPARLAVDPVGSGTTGSPRATSPGRPAPAGPQSVAKAGPIDSDPRQIGMNYYYLVYTSPSNARMLAEFCRENGLEAYVVRGNNPQSQLRHVMVLPGYASGEGDSAAVRELKKRIDAVTSKWSVRTKDTLVPVAMKFTG